MDTKKRKITLEYPVNCTVVSLFAKLSTDEGLGSWFADRVERNEDQFTFFWRKIPQEAALIARRENKFVRFRWADEADQEVYFEFRITPHELTGDIALSVTDFSAHEEYEDAIRMWENNIKNLKRTLGCGQ